MKSVARYEIPRIAMISSGGAEKIQPAVGIMLNCVSAIPIADVGCELHFPGALDIRRDLVKIILQNAASPRSNLRPSSGVNDNLLASNVPCPQSKREVLACCIPAIRDRGKASSDAKSSYFRALEATIFSGKKRKSMAGEGQVVHNYGAV